MKNVFLTESELIQLVESTVNKTINALKIPKKEEKAVVEILSIEQATELLNLAKPTIYSLTSKGKIPHFKKRKKLYFKRSELLQWIEQGKQKTVAEEQREMDEYLAKKAKK